jgi:hypothetical protein
MKRLTFTFFLLSLFTSLSLAVTGDTIRVPVMDKYLWTWNGYQDRRVLCPDTSKTFEKILLRYTLTCPAGGCGEWDYTTGIILRQHTGIIDSTLRDAANFTVNGAIQDTVTLSEDTTFATSFNTKTKKTDTTANPTLLIEWYDDPNQPFTPTDNDRAWKAGYWNYLYDTTGAKTDSFYVASDTTLYAVRTPTYVKYERTTPYELTRYITPYGKGFPKDWTRTWTMDVTDFSSLLHDSVELRSFYDGWSQGSLYTLELLFIEGTPARTTYRVEQIYNGYFPYGNVDNSIENYLTPKKIFRDQNADMVTLRLTVSGHGSDPNGACEFIDKTHSIAVNGVDRYQQHLWRTDCGLNPTYPQTGTYWFPRAGWCPGDLVYPFDYDLTPFSTKGDSLTVDYNMEEYESSSPSGGYNVHGLVFYSSGPNKAFDVAAEDIIQPTSDYRYARRNPICDGMKPVVVIRNLGAKPLTTCRIEYIVDGGPIEMYTWNGNLAFMEKAEVMLPTTGGLPSSGTGTFYFRVRYSEEFADPYPNNDAMSTTFSVPKSFSNKIAFSLKMDKCPQPNAIRWELTDASGSVIEEGGDYADAQQVRDTFLLEQGCYRFTIYDEGLGEGLRPWVYSGSTNGSYSLKDDKNATIINVASGSNAAVFGNMQSTTFNVIGPSLVETAKDVTTFSVYPNPAQSSISLDLQSFANEALTITLYDVLGKALMIRQAQTAIETIDIGELPEGSYIMRVESATMKASQQIVIER